jgi:hypothetical protein
MNKNKTLTRKEKLQAWFDGDIEDSELTDKDLKWLQHAVFDAIAEKSNAIGESKEVH